MAQRSDFLGGMGIGNLPTSIHHQLLHECFFTLLQIKAFLHILEIVGDRLTQFHFELYAVIEAYQVVASVDYLGAYVQQGKYFVVAKLFKTFFEL